MTLRPISLADANAFVAKHHSHHKPVQGCKFAVSAWDNGRLAGVHYTKKYALKMKCRGDTIIPLEGTYTPKRMKP